MSIPCRIEIDETATITTVDDVFCALMRDTRAHLVGTYVLAMMPLQDRSDCYAGFARVRRSGESFATTKRLIRRDGTYIWIRKTCREIAVHAGERRFVMEIEPCATPAAHRTPDRLLAVARTILDSRRRRNATFGADLFPDVAWDILLSTYVAEAEGRMMSQADVHAASGAPPAVISRWVRALHEADLLDDETHGEPGLVTTPLHLSAATHERFEDYLSALIAIPELVGDGAGRLSRGANRRWMPEAPGLAPRTRRFLALLYLTYPRTIPRQ